MNSPYSIENHGKQIVAATLGIAEMRIKTGKVAERNGNNDVDMCHLVRDQVKTTLRLVSAQEDHLKFAEMQLKRIQKLRQGICDAKQFLGGGDLTC